MDERKVVDTLKVRDARDVEEVVRAAIASEQPLEIIGHGTRRAIGHPMATNAVLDVSALNAVSAYEPNELIITVQAGAPLADVQSLIDSKNQQFAFEPMDTSALLGVSGNGTIGGMIGAGLAGPRRIKAGGARDHLLGAHAVSGFGDSFKTGGRVVKNVTGYDLCKLLAGSWGTLAVMTEVTLKVMPKPESERTLVLAGLDDVTANRAMTAALGSPYDVSGAAHLPSSVFGSATGALARLGATGRALTLLRLEGIAASVADRAGSLGKALAAFGAVEMLQDDASAAVWADIRDVEPFAASGARGLWPVWRIVCPPASGGALGQAAGARVRRRRDLRLGRRPDLGGAAAEAGRAGRVGPRAGRRRGRPCRADPGLRDIRRNVDVFHPQAGGVAALSQRVRHSFDPRIILNRGRMLLIAAT